MLLNSLSILGLCVAAITGALAAGRKKMDFFGVVIIACITALGGGTVRDVLFNFYPLTWVANPEYLIYTSFFALVTIAAAPFFRKILRMFLILDALGLSAFVVIGTQKALEHGLTPGIAIISGMIAGICGGMLRDILCNDIPLVLRKEIYALIALGGAILFIILKYFQISENLTIMITLVSIFSFRLFVIFYHIQVPVFDYSDNLKKR